MRLAAALIAANHIHIGSEREVQMQKDERDLLEVLKFELNFLNKGGYGRSPREPWRPQFVFEDSSTCMNYDCRENPDPCSNCILMQLVPPDLRDEKIPCRHIPLDSSGETLDSVYRYEDQHEVEEKVAAWLRETIERLEAERQALSERPDIQTPPAGQSIRGIPLYHSDQSLHPKCANPACPTAFHWLAGGKFFRFRPKQASSVNGAPVSELPSTHGVKHYWLCERCSHIFTLAHSEGFGVILQLLWLELPVVETPKALTAE